MFVDYIMIDINKIINIIIMIAVKKIIIKHRITIIKHRITIIIKFFTFFYKPLNT
jgi:hypothetical protein